MHPNGACVKEKIWWCHSTPLLPCSSGSSERENEWGAQQAFVRHRRSSAHWVQWKTAAPSKGTHGRPGGQGKACAHTFVEAAAHIVVVIASQNRWIYRSACPPWIICFDTLLWFSHPELPHSGPRELPETAWRVPPHQGQWDLNESPNLKNWKLQRSPHNWYDPDRTVHPTPT